MPSPVPNPDTPFRDGLLGIKSMLQQREINFAAIQEAFLTLVETVPEFPRAGIKVKALRPVEDALIQAVFQEHGLELRDAQTKFFVRLPEFGFLHGSMLFGAGAIVTVILFTDIQVGLLTHCSPQTPLTKFLRISTTPPGAGSASLN